MGQHGMPEPVFLHIFAWHSLWHGGLSHLQTITAHSRPYICRYVSESIWSNNAELSVGILALTFPRSASKLCLERFKFSQLTGNTFFTYLFNTAHRIRFLMAIYSWKFRISIQLRLFYSLKAWLWTKFQVEKGRMMILNPVVGLLGIKVRQHFQKTMKTLFF